jgi:hypothetical protein
VLPQVSGRGNRPRFCQDGRSWSTRDLNCRDAEGALANADSIRDDSVALDDSVIAALGKQIGLALPPAQQLLETPVGIRGQLDTTVADALEQRDAPTTQAERDRQLRALAEAAAHTAADEAAAAVRAATEAVAAQGSRRT